MEHETIFLISGLLEIGCIIGIVVGAMMCCDKNTRERGCFVGIFSAGGLIVVANVVHAIVH